MHLGQPEEPREIMLHEPIGSDKGNEITLMDISAATSTWRSGSKRLWSRDAMKDLRNFLVGNERCWSCAMG